MIVVIDSNVVYSGLYSRHGTSFQILKAIRNEELIPAISVPLFEEYRDVLSRPPLSEIFGASERDEFVDYLCQIGRLTEVFFLWRPFLKDPKDDMVLEVAIASGSKWIITHNLKNFRRLEVFGIEAIRPDEYLKRKGRVK